MEIYNGDLQQASMQGHGIHREGEGQETPEGTECITPASRPARTRESNTECRSRPNQNYCGPI